MSLNPCTFCKGILDWLSDWFFVLFEASEACCCPCCRLLLLPGWILLWLLGSLSKLGGWRIAFIALFFCVQKMRWATEVCYTLFRLTYKKTGLLQRKTCQKMETISCPDSETISCPILETISCPKMETIRYPLLETISCPILETISYPILETISCLYSETISCPILETIS